MGMERLRDGVLGFWRGGEVEGGFGPEVVLPQKWFHPRTCWKMERLGVFFGGRHFAPEVVLPQNLLEDGEVRGVFWREAFCPRTYILLSLLCKNAFGLS